MPVICATADQGWPRPSGAPRSLAAPTSAANGCTMTQLGIEWPGRVSLGLSVGAGPVFDASTAAAEQLLHPELYVRAVLGDP